MQTELARQQAAFDDITTAFMTNSRLSAQMDGGCQEPHGQHALPLALSFLPPHPNRPILVTNQMGPKTLIFS